MPGERLRQSGWNAVPFDRVSLPGATFLEALHDHHDDVEKRRYGSGHDVGGPPVSCELPQVAPFGIWRESHTFVIQKNRMANGEFSHVALV